MATTTKAKRLQVKKNRGTQKRAALYLRMSSDAQGKESLEQQREQCLLYAADNGYEVIEEYADEGITGVSSRGRRKQFQELVADAEAGKFDFVICWDQSRASRSKPREFFAEMNPLADAGVKLVFTDCGEVDLDDFGDFLQSAVKSNSNNDFIKDLARRVVRGQHDKARMGLLVSGSPPFGYRSVQVVDENGKPARTKKGQPLMGKLALGDPEAVKTVQLIFDWYLEGLSIRGIVERLRSDRGQDRSHRFVQKILSSPFYVGDYQWNAESRAKHAASRGERVVSKDAGFKTGRTAAEDRVYIPDNHDRIIDRETFNRVQVLRGERKLVHAPFQNGGDHLLTGMCWCAKCGNKFSGHKMRDRVTISCNGYRTGKCAANYINQDEVVGIVITSLEEYFDADRIAKLRNKLIDRLQQGRQSVDVDKLKKQLKAKQAEYTEFRAKFRTLPADLIDDFADDLRVMKSEVEKLEEQIRSASTSVEVETQAFDEQADKLLGLIGQLHEVVATVGAEKPHLIRELIATIVDRIVLNVGDYGKGKNPRFYLDAGGEIQLKAAFNLLPLS